MNKYNTAILGATGVVGEELIDLLQEFDFPVKTLYPIASAKSTSKAVVFKGKVHNILSIDDVDCSKVDLVFCAVSNDIAKELLPRFNNAVIIDKSSLNRSNPNIPLVLSGVNDNILSENKSKIIAMPNCCVIPLATLLYYLPKTKRVVVSTYQSVSGAGADAMNKLMKDTVDHLSKRKIDSSETLAFNVVPDIPQEEEKIEYETRRILNKDINLSVTCVRVPVVIGHSMSVNIEFDSDIDLEDIANL